MTSEVGQSPNLPHPQRRPALNLGVPDVMGHLLNSPLNPTRLLRDLAQGW